MTRTRTQLVALAVYAGFGVFAMLLPGLLLDMLGVRQADQAPVALLLARMFGAVCLGLALALFFTLRDHLGGKRVMRAFAGLEAAVIAAVVISLGADDIGLRQGLPAIAGSAVIGLINLYGAFLAPAKAREQTGPEPVEA
jgi:hypothetical protein